MIYKGVSPCWARMPNTANCWSGAKSNPRVLWAVAVAGWLGLRVFWILPSPELRWCHLRLPSRSILSLDLVSEAPVFTLQFTVSFLPSNPEYFAFSTGVPSRRLSEGGWPEALPDPSLEGETACVNIPPVTVNNQMFLAWASTLHPCRASSWLIECSSQWTPLSYLQERTRGSCRGMARSWTWAPGLCRCHCPVRWPGVNRPQAAIFTQKMGAMVSAPPIQPQHWDDGRGCPEAQCDRSINGAFMSLAVKARCLPGADSALTSPCLLVCEEHWKDTVLFTFGICMW